MSNKFCPECGADCRHHLEQCPDCQFPLALELRNRDGDLILRGDHIRRWNRIAQLLRRSGLVVEIQPDQSVSMLWWWALPGAGLLFLLISLAFGARLANAIWPPPVQNVAILDLSKETDDQSQPESDPSFLADALRASDDQNIEEDDMPEVEIRDIAEYDAIKSHTESVFVTVSVDNRFRSGILINDSGLVLTTLNNVTGAFERRRSTITEGTSLTQDTITIFPKTASLNGPSSDAQLYQESIELGIAALSSPITGAPTCRLDFDSYPDPGDRVWIGIVRAGQAYPEQAEVIRSTMVESTASYMALNSSLGSASEGAPVFNQYGDVIGILLIQGGSDLMLPLRSIRERAPLIYKGSR